MSEAPLTTPPPTPEEIKRDPLVAQAVARVADAIVGAKEFAGEITLNVAVERIRAGLDGRVDDGSGGSAELGGVRPGLDPELRQRVGRRLHHLDRAFLEVGRS